MNVFGGEPPADDPLGVAATVPRAPPGPPPPPQGAVKRALTDAADTQPHKYQTAPAGSSFEARSAEAKLKGKMARAKAAAKPLPGAPAAKALPAAPPTAPTVTPAKVEKYDIGSPPDKVRNPAPKKNAPSRNAKGVPETKQPEAPKVRKNMKQTDKTTKAEPRGNRKGARSFAIVPAM